MAYELDGTIKLINETQTFSKGFTKREFVVTTDDRFPQDIKFELVKEKTSLVDKHQVGDRVRVTFDVRGSEYNGKYFVNLQAWKLAEGQAQEESSDAAPRRNDPPARPAQRSSAPPKNQPQGPDDAVVEMGDDDGIPF